MFLSIAHFTPTSQAVPVQKAASKPFLLSALFLVFLLVQSLGAFARSAPESFADLVEAISPSVVNITTSTKVAENMAPRGIVPEGSPFEDLFWR